MGVGCGITLVLQAAWYVLTNLGLVLIGPIYCAFITKGGSGTIITYILCGIMLSIYRYQNVAAESENKPGGAFHYKNIIKHRTDY